MRTTKVSFFKMLARLESTYKDNPDYPEYGRDILKKLIAFVQECYYDFSENRVFISRNFRLSPEEMCALWNAQHPDKTKQLKTFYSQISTYSNDLYGLFGEDIENYFVVLDDADHMELAYREELSGVSETIDAMDIANIATGDIFLAEFETAMAMAEPVQDLDLEECQEELYQMQKMMKAKVWQAISRIDMGKAAKIRSVLRKPLFEPVGGGRHRTNHEKVALLKMFKILPEARKPQKVCMHGALQDVIGISLKANKSTTINNDHVDELAEILSAYYTQEGVSKFVGRYNMYEFKEAMDKVQRGIGKN